jgi:hypothetical protein
MKKILATAAIKKNSKALSYIHKPKNILYGKDQFLHRY